MFRLLESPGVAVVSPHLHSQGHQHQPFQAQGKKVKKIVFFYCSVLPLLILIILFVQATCWNRTSELKYIIVGIVIMLFLRHLPSQNYSLFLVEEDS